MKKLLYSILFLLLICPVIANAEVKYDHKQRSNVDGLVVVDIYAIISGDNDSFTEFNANLSTKNATITEINGTTDFIKQENSVVSPDGTTATIYTKSSQAHEKGNVKIATVTYKYDKANIKKEDVSLYYAVEGGAQVEIKPVDAEKTGSIVPLAGICVGIALVGASFVISKKQKKLYNI